MLQVKYKKLRQKQDNFMKKLDFYQLWPPWGS